MKIILSGYGKMGHEIERIALERGHTIVGIFDTKQDWEVKTIPQADVVIDFSLPESAPEVVLRCFRENIPVLSGTTGWNSRLQEVRRIAKEEKKAFFYSSNYSLGVNIFFEINRSLASFLKQYNYDVKIHEVHHIHKKDAPSGTAITLAEDIIHESVRYTGWSCEKQENDKILITSERTGEVPGTHIINWDSTIDSIEIRHTAHNRTGLAVGAVIAAEWLMGKTGVFSMKDLMAGESINQ